MGYNGTCLDRYVNPANGIEYMCVEDDGHDTEHGTMHHADTAGVGPVNW